MSLCNPLYEILYADPARLVETGVTIMCSSMPAFASFSKAWAAHSGYFAVLYSHLSSRFTLSTFKAKVNSSFLSEARIDPFRANRFTAHLNSQEDISFGSEKYRGSNRYPLNNTTTEVHGAACTDDIEDGIIRKSVTVLQSST